MKTTWGTNHIVNDFKKYSLALTVGGLLITLSLFWFNETGSRSFLVFAGLLTIIGIYVSYLSCTDTLIRKENQSKAFAGVLLILSIIYVFIFPPLTVPDEAHHFYSSYWLADAITGQVNEEGFLVRSSDWNLFANMQDNAIDFKDYQTVLSNFELFQTDQSYETVDYFTFSLGSENPPAKIATTLAILLGKLLNLGTYPLFYLGRLFNAISYAICAFIAYRLMPFGKNVVMGISLLPMTLHLVGSYSYDVGIISLAMLLTAMLLKAIFDDGLIKRALTASILVASALLAPCKLIYSTIILLVLFIPNRRFQSKRTALLYKGGVLVAPLLAILALRMASISDLAVVTQQLDVRGSETGHFYELAFILHNPMAAIAIFFRSLIVQGDFYWSTALGRSLGWFQADIATPYFYCIPLLLGLILTAQQDSLDTQKIPAWLRMALLVIAGMTFAGSMLSMFIGHTFDTEPIIQGVQGRYILPVAVPLVLALRSNNVQITRDAFPTILTVFSITNLVFLMHVVACAIV